MNFGSQGKGWMRRVFLLLAEQFNLRNNSPVLVTGLSITCRIVIG